MGSKFKKGFIGGTLLGGATGGMIGGMVGNNMDIKIGNAALEAQRQAFINNKNSFADSIGQLS